jgi:hypothetical protein
MRPRRLPPPGASHHAPPRAALAPALLLALALAGCRPAAHAPLLRAPDPPAATTAMPVQVTVEPDVRPGGDAPTGAPTRRSNLQRALDGLRGPAEVRLSAGYYDLLPDTFTDPTCGNCEDPATPVPATFGARIAGRGIELIGAGPDDVIIRTNAGYGLYFDGCDGCVLQGVTVTGGVRDADGRATDGGVVVRDGTVMIRDCAIRDNIGDPATVAETVVGIAGLVGREGGELRVQRCAITRNSWDGIALYRGALAHIHENVIDGVDRARGATVGGGRGVGIGLTWDARATVIGNLVRNYWKGIGVFVNAEATVAENIVEDILTWGLAYWAAGESNAPVAHFHGNAVYRTGACGAMLDRAAPPAPGQRTGSLRGNLFIETGQDPRYDEGEPYCWQRPIARHAVPPGFELAGNLVLGARQPGHAWPLEPELDRATFDARAAATLERLRRRPSLITARLFDR